MPARGRGKPLQKRPDDWTQERVIEMVSGGLPLKAVCETFAERDDCEASSTALLQETNRWRKRSPDFAKQIVTAMESNGSHPIAIRKGKPGKKKFELVTGDEEWWNRFIEYYATAKQPTVAGACEAAGINYRTFYARISDFDGNPNFDPELAKRWNALRQSMAGWFLGVSMDAVPLVENDYLRGLLADRISRRLTGEDRRSSVDVKVSGEVDHRHEHIHRVEARRHIRNRMKAICTTAEGVEVLPP